MTDFPDVLLPEILDYLDLEELLFSAMPVDRFWRSSAIEHPRYWKFISLDEESTHERRVHSADLFFLRLARAGAKPVDLRISVKDPTAVLDALTRELYHIRRLTMWTAVRNSDLLFQSMRDTPAPILDSLWLTLIDDPLSQELGFVPEVLFALDSPVLTRVSLENIALPSGGELPKWLAHANITSFSYNLHSRLPSHRFPNVFSIWPHLISLDLGDGIEFTDPAFLQAGTWAGLDSLGLYGRLVGRLAALPLVHIPRILIADTIFLSADDLVFIADVLMNPGPLDVTLNSFESHHPESTLPPDVHLTIVLRCLPDAGTWRWRWARGQLPRDAPGKHPEDFVTGLQHPPLITRIASLSISLESWDTLVGRGYLAQFPAVEDLALTLGLWFHAWNETWHAPARGAKLESPRLCRIVFKYQHYEPAYRKPVLQPADLAEFITAQLSGVRLPLRVALEGVEVEGETVEFAEVLKL